MKNFEEKLKSVSHQIMMSERERKELKSRILSEIEGEKKYPVVSPYTNVWYFIRKHSFSVAFVAVLFFGGSLSSLAEGSLPGDMLYSLKVGVNEEVLGWFAKSDDAKSEWQISLAERRLDEIEELQEIGPLSVDSIQQMEEKINEHTRNAEERVGTIEGEDLSIEVASDEAPASLLMKATVSIEEASSTDVGLTEATLVASSAPVFSEVEDLKNDSDVDSRESLKNLRAKIVELKNRVENLQGEKIFIEKSKVRLILIRARENLFKADAMLIDGQEDGAKDLLRRAEENIFRAENMVKSFELRPKEEVRGAKMEVPNKYVEDAEDVR